MQNVLIRVIRLTEGCKAKYKLSAVYPLFSFKGDPLSPASLLAVCTQSVAQLCCFLPLPELSL